MAKYAKAIMLNFIQSRSRKWSRQTHFCSRFRMLPLWGVPSSAVMGRGCAYYIQNN